MGKSRQGNDRLSEGVYERLITEDVLASLADVPSNQVVSAFVDQAESPQAISKHVASIVERALDGLAPEAQLAKANEILDGLGAPYSALPGTRPEQLLEITGPDAAASIRPESGLVAPVLLTNARGEPSLGAELKAELATAESVDLLSAFIRWTGLRTIEAELMRLKERGVKLRVLTTTYIGATEKRALDELVRRFGAEVRVNYETNSTRLHAKAWMFKRHSGLTTAYVGSSNLSHAALIDGLEWNVRISEAETPNLTRKFESTFESYWNLDDFEPYDPDNDGQRLKDALSQSAAYDKTVDDLDFTGFQVRPYAHQEQILESLAAERHEHDRHRNLVIAATGTGKTVVAALDYVRLFADLGDYPRLLFIAHRKEILQQSLKTYRAVLSDGTFGELLVDGQKPTENKHVFASVQSLTTGALDSYEPSAFDVLVIDEFHHAEAPTYRAILDHFKPKELLGLTATPERGDNVDVRDAFFDGRAAAEIRLWDALDADLLVPFHYFGVSDNTDLSSVEWNSKKGTYDTSALTEAYTGEAGRLRAGIIGRALHDKVTTVAEMRALGFCASVEHARFMTEQFNAMNIPSKLVVGETPRDERQESLTALRRGDVRCLFTVDVFNEGLDIPQVDTVLMLRPTQSSTVFLQQLGRGLRRAPQKSVLTVLDFIGFQRKEFKFENVLRAMTGTSRSKLVHEIEQGFPFLPAGSQIILDRVAQDAILENVKQQLKLDSGNIAADVASYFAAGETPDLSSYLERSGRSLSDFYAKFTWTQVREVLGLATPTGQPAIRAQLLKRMRSLIHVDDADRSNMYRNLVSDTGASLAALTPLEKTYAMMLTSILSSDANPNEYATVLSEVRQDREIRAEIEEILSVAEDKSRRLPMALTQNLADTPLRSHATFTRSEALLALGYSSNPSAHVAGVAWCESTQTDALFVTLNKSDKAFSPTTMYRDYALNEKTFHWESQNSTRSASPTGQRYITHAQNHSNVVIFTRSTRSDNGITSAYTCLGEVNYVSHTGELPMSITWSLDRPMPQQVYLQASAVAH